MAVCTSPVRAIVGLGLQGLCQTRLPAQFANFNQMLLYKTR